MGLRPFHLPSSKVSPAVTCPIYICASGSIYRVICLMDSCSMDIGLMDTCIINVLELELEKEVVVTLQRSHGLRAKGTKDEVKQSHRAAN